MDNIQIILKLDKKTGFYIVCLVKEDKYKAVIFTKEEIE